MSIEYKSPVDGKMYSFNYQELKEKYFEINEMSDSVFSSRIPEILHFCCFVGFLKGLDSSILLGDGGLIHELVHLLHIPEEPLINLDEIRKNFKILMRLA